MTEQIQPTLKLFVWHGVLVDYTDGIMFALAENVDQARDLIRASFDDPRDAYGLEVEPSVYVAPEGFHLYGGG